MRLTRGLCSQAGSGSWPEASWPARTGSEGLVPGPHRGHLMSGTGVACASPGSRQLGTQLRAAVLGSSCPPRLLQSWESGATSEVAL